MQFFQLVEFYSRQPVDELRTRGLAPVAANVRCKWRLWPPTEVTPTTTGSCSSSPRAGRQQRRGAHGDQVGIRALDELARRRSGVHDLTVMQQFGGPTNPAVDAVSAATPGAG